MSERCDEYWRLYVRWRQMQAAAMEAVEGHRDAAKPTQMAEEMRAEIVKHYQTCEMCRAWLEEVKE
jgi:hypothetical protein